MIRSLRAVARTLLRNEGGPAVLMYHRIAEADCDPFGLAVSPARFNEQLTMLKREREVLTLAEFGALLAQCRLPERATAITFDDGYACNALIAAPILQAHGLPATFFLATGAVGGNREFWWDELARLVIETSAATHTIIRIGTRSFAISFGAPPVPRAALKAWTWSASTQYERLQLYMTIWAEMRTLRHIERVAILDAMGQACAGSSHARDTHRALTWDEVRMLDQHRLFQIAPHTVTHPALGSLPEMLQKQEILDSREACEALSGKTARLFAYPYGDFTSVTAGIVREAGFDLACGTHAQLVPVGCDRFAIPRLQVLDRSAILIARELNQPHLRTRREIIESG